MSTSPVTVLYSVPLIYYLWTFVSLFFTGCSEISSSHIYSLLNICCMVIVILHIVYIADIYHACTHVSIVLQKLFADYHKFGYSYILMYCAHVTLAMTMYYAFPVVFHAYRQLLLLFFSNYSDYRYGCINILRSLHASDMFYILLYCTTTFALYPLKFLVPIYFYCNFGNRYLSIYTFYNYATVMVNIFTGIFQTSVQIIYNFIQMFEPYLHSKVVSYVRTLMQSCTITCTLGLFMWGMLYAATSPVVVCTMKSCLTSMVSLVTYDFPLRCAF